MALVQAQALACGLRLVCSDRTGGEDLKEFMENPNRVTVVPHGDVVRLAQALETALADAANERGLRDSLGNSRSRLSWRAYGERYSSALKQKLAATKDLHKNDCFITS